MYMEDASERWVWVYIMQDIGKKLQHVCILCTLRCKCSTISSGGLLHGWSLLSWQLECVYFQRWEWEAWTDCLLESSNFQTLEGHSPLCGVCVCRRCVRLWACERERRREGVFYRPRRHVSVWSKDHFKVALIVGKGQRCKKMLGQKI